MSLRIYLTGRLTIERDGRAIVEERDLPGRQGRLAFAYLGAHHRRATPRETFTDVLWTGDEAADGDAGFSSVLSRLRGLLKKAGVDALIEVDHGSVGLRLPADAWTDLEAAANAIDLCEGAVRRSELSAAWGPANVAIVIARRPFLPGEDAPWIAAVRQKLSATLVRALHALVAISAGNGEPAVAIQHAEEILQVEPYRETAYQELMKLHAAMGNRAEALRVFTRCRDTLRADLHTSPSNQTLETWKVIEQG